MNPKFLDSQSEIKIDKWVDVGSEECNLLDNTPDFTKKILKMGFEEPDPYLITDWNGRVWGKPNANGKYFPLHFEYGKQLIGYRISKNASN